MRRVVPLLLACMTAACSTAAADTSATDLGCSAGQSLLAFASILVPLFYMKRHPA